jgi:hypothetical protein
MWQGGEGLQRVVDGGESEVRRVEKPGRRGLMGIGAAEK